MKKSEKIKKIQFEIQSFAKEEKKKFFQNYFKFYDFPNRNPEIKPDIFLGVIVRDLRKIAKKYYLNLSFDEIEFFITSRIQEYRFFALVILAYQFRRAVKKNNIEFIKKIKDFYLNFIDYINNWNLVDTSAPNIIGKYLFLFPEEKKLLWELAKSQHIWKERVAILSTFFFIKNHQFDEFLELMNYFLTKENHFLIQRAIGWGLREIGKKDEILLIEILKKNHFRISKIIWDYATEKLDKSKLTKKLK